MTTAQLDESLARAKHGMSAANFAAIIYGFAARGIPADDIQPRENVFTYNAWKAQGRQVRRGEKGVAIQTWIPIPDKQNNDGTTRRGGLRPRTAYVFHVTQTDPA